MTEGETLFLIWTVVTCAVAFVTGFLCSFYSGYFEYKKGKQKILSCKHEYFTKVDNYSHVVYDSQLNVSKITYKFKCSDCGLIKYKDF